MMRKVFAGVEVLNFKKSKEVKALIDTEQVWLLFLEKLAEEVNIKIEDEVIIDVEIIKIKRDKAWISLEGRERIFFIWVSDVIDKVLIGAIVLETFGLEVDTITGKLKKRSLLRY